MMDALAVFLVLAIMVFGTHWLDYVCDFVLMPIFIGILVYRCSLLARGIPWAKH